MIGRQSYSQKNLWYEPNMLHSIGYNIIASKRCKLLLIRSDSYERNLGIISKNIVAGYLLQFCRYGNYHYGL